MEQVDVTIVGGGVAGITAGLFTARHGRETLVVTAGSPILRRNAHLENFPGFPAGVNARLLLDMMRDQAVRNGCTFREASVVSVSPANGGFVIETDSDESIATRAVIAATKNDVEYLRNLDGITIIDLGKEFIETDDRGRTGVEGIYVAGRLAGKPHQAIVAAGHGAEVATTLLEDDDRPFYHDWVAPMGYFTGRGRDVPPGCEEIDEDERRRREQRSIDVMREYFEKSHPDRPEQHPAVVDD